MLRHLEKNDDYDALIGHGRVLVDFFATWCPPCKMLTPELEKLAAEKDDLPIIKVDVDLFPAIAGRYGVQSIPTLILHQDGKEIDRHLGYLPLAHLRRLIDR